MENSLEMEDMLNMLERIVNIDSGSTDKAGVDEFGSYLKEIYSNIGFEIEEVTNSEVGNNLILKHREAMDPEILVLAHMDTVFAKGTADERPFSIKGDRAYGPGVIDMKASHVMLYHSLKHLIEGGSEVHKNIVVLFNSDEEMGSIHSRDLIETVAKDMKYALVMEPARTDGSIVSARRGGGRYQLNIAGKAAHSGIEPEKGRSAIKELAHKIFQIEDLSAPDENLHVNVVEVSGGQAPNVISPNAEATVDVRISTQEQGERIDGKIREITAETNIDGTHIELEGGINRPPMEYTEGTGHLVSLIQQEAESMGISVSHTATGGGSDASYPAALGIAAVDGLGPVGGKQHSSEEYLELDSLIERTRLFIGLLQQL